MKLRSPRRDLAATIAAWDLAPAVFDGVTLEGDPRSLTVYGAPPGGIDPPAVVIAPGTPYFERTAFENGQWRFTLALIVARTDEPYDVDMIEDWWTSLWEALETEPNGMAMSLTPAGIVTIGGNRYLFVQTDFVVQQ